MNFTELFLPGVYQIDVKKFEDDRGFFTRLFCKETLSQKGLESDFSQCSLSDNPRKSTLRGMHYQEAPFEEVKLITCLSGSIYDCLIDLRPDSPTYLRHLAIELSASCSQLLYVPKGLAHGFLTLEPKTQVLYQISTPYHRTAARGIRYNDPHFQIPWPLVPEIVSSRDLSYPLIASQ